MIITGRRFTQIGEALFGPGKWYPAMAEMVKAERTAIWRFATGKAVVTADVKARLASLCRARGEALIKIAAELDV